MLYIGVTGDALLSGKSHRHLVQSYDAREASARAFVAALRPSLRVDTSQLTEAPPKAATSAAMTALVISRETLAGGRAVQAQRCAPPQLRCACFFAVLSRVARSTRVR